MVNNKSKKILSEISFGDLLDKISILEIKISKIKDKESLFFLKKEYKSLTFTKKKQIKMNKKLKKLYLRLKKTNLILWNIEDKIRLHEKKKNFKKSFVELARKVYMNNDIRAKIKREINKLTNSNIKEIKKYIYY